MTSSSISLVQITGVSSPFTEMTTVRVACDKRSSSSADSGTTRQSDTPAAWQPSMNPCAGLPAEQTSNGARSFAGSDRYRASVTCASNSLKERDVRRHNPSRAAYPTLR
ncbi:hypothetical protein [Candidatus Methylomirabilis limnetica]|uniref:hypothetical protein n=1 Tax=Candidatus Methylomirabilis limnetica TaxID=2033718 RepID=UPI0010575439|nr:hypothetical protein [Candidatus Methylomirabilis limnetica]